MRLQTHLAKCGVASRRKAMILIQEGRVRVNGSKITEPGFPVQPKDRVVFQGRALEPERRVYFLFHKPRNVVTTAKDPQGRKTVLDFFRSVKTRIYPVGRLDRNTTGLLILTNDGDFALHLTHPRNEVVKGYRVALHEPLSESAIQKIRKGVRMDHWTSLPARVDSAGRQGKFFYYRLYLREGKNREIRRIMDRLGVRVASLHRFAIGSAREVLSNVFAAGNRLLGEDAQSVDGTGAGFNFLAHRVCRGEIERERIEEMRALATLLPSILFALEGLRGTWRGG